MNKRIYTLAVIFLAGSIYVKAQVNPDTAQKVSIDRFSMEAGHLFLRDNMNGLPGPNEPVDFDQGPFITKGFGPNGELISYYNFDVQPEKPAPIYVLFKQGETSPVPGQLNIVNVIPGDTSYNDFWEIQKVTVPANYIANSITNYEAIMDSGYNIEETSTIVNCPIVPFGSTAKLRLTNESPDLTRGWYKGKVVYYFNFSEKALMTNQSGMVPESDIYVSFNINPDQPGGGPPSGFKTDSTGRAHNVAETLPSDSGYSPLWDVNIYDNTDFAMVHNLTTVMNAKIVVMGAAVVNCPIVSIESITSIADENSSIPKRYSLEQNYPNPFNPSTQIKFSLANNDHVIIKIYNSIGQEVALLINQFMPAGNYTLTWDASNISSGVYFYTLSTNNFKAAKKMILLR